MALSLGNRSYTLGFIIALQDNFSAQAKVIRDGLKGLSTENNMYMHNLQSARNMYSGIAAAGALALREAYRWMDYGMDFDYMMKGTQAVTRATREELKQLSALAVDVGVETMFMPKDIADAMRYLGLAGFEAKDIMKTIRSAAHLAGATMSELGGEMGAASVVAKVLHGFNLPMDNATRVADILATGVTKSNTLLTDLAEALKYVAATSTDLAVPLETTTALAMALGNAGIQGSMAGTAMENMFRYLAMGLSQFKTNRQSKAWESLGLGPEQLMDVNQNLRPIGEVLKMIGEQLKGKGTVQVQGILKEIFGVRGKRAGSAIIRMMDDFERFQDMLENHSKGRAQNVMNDMMDSMWGSRDKMQSAAEGFFVSYTKALEPLLKSLFNIAKVVFEGLEKFVSHPMGKIAAGVLTVATAFVTLTAAAKAALAVIGLFLRGGMGSLSGMAAALNMTMASMLGVASTGTIAAWKAGAQPTAGSTYVVGRDQTLKYSEKRGMYYTTAPGTGAARWISKNQGPVSSITPKTGFGFMGFLGKAGGFMGKALGILGPVGLAVSIFLPLLSPILGSLKKSEKNTSDLAEYLASEKEKDRISKIFSNQEVLSVLGQKSLNDLVLLFTQALTDFRQLYGINATLQLIKDKKPSQILYENGVALTLPEFKIPNK